MSRGSLGRLIWESVLIVFSVLLALLLNEYRTNLREARQMEAALGNIEQELLTNLEILHQWWPYHQEEFRGFDAATESDSMLAALVSDQGIQFYKIMHRGVIQRLLSRSAWEAAGNTGVLTGLEFGRLMSLSGLYDLQERGVEGTINAILDVLKSRETMRAVNLEETVRILRLAFGELVSQEEFLIHSYEATLREVYGTEPPPRSGQE